MSKFNVMVIGKGGREDALVWKIAQSPLVEKIFAVPGNAGMMRRWNTHCVNLPLNDPLILNAFARAKDIGLVVVGPEGPLGNGIVDDFMAAGITAFGPTKQEAMLEFSKCFTKQILWDYHIPTADGEICQSVASALSYVKTLGDETIVVKPDGPTGGKGVKVCSDESARKHICAVMQDHIYQDTGDSGEQILIEKYLPGRKMSLTVLTDGRRYLMLPSSEDHKQLYDNDYGPMTGGMGAVSPSPIATPQLEKEIEDDIVKPLLPALRSRLRGFRGVLYIALMIVERKPYVLEINVRFGNPEAQVILPRVRNDVVPIFLKIAKGELENATVRVSPDSYASVVITSQPYPDTPHTGQVITGVEEVEDWTNILIFHAGTGLLMPEKKLVVTGGRVVNVVSWGRTLAGALGATYRGVKQIHFGGAHYRNDIGQRK